MAQDCVAILECTIAWSERRQEPPARDGDRAASPAPLPGAGGASAVPAQRMGFGQTRKDPREHAAWDPPEQLRFLHQLCVVLI